MHPNYSALKTLAKSIVGAVITAVTLGVVQMINDYLKHPVDLSVGSVVIPALVVSALAVAIKNIIKQSKVK